MKDFFKCLTIVAFVAVVATQLSSHKTTHAISKPTPKTATRVLAAIVPKPVVVAPVAVPITPPTHLDLIVQAGISADNFQYVNYIVSHESNWNPDATEPTSGAHGLPQALPYSKTGCGWDDSVCQLQWANAYAISRYGSWYEAYIYWVNHHNW